MVAELGMVRAAEVVVLAGGPWREGGQLLGPGVLAGLLSALFYRELLERLEEWELRELELPEGCLR